MASSKQKKDYYSNMAEYIIEQAKYVNEIDIYNRLSIESEDLKESEKFDKLSSEADSNYQLALLKYEMNSASSPLGIEDFKLVFDITSTYLIYFPECMSEDLFSGQDSKVLLESVTNCMEAQTIIAHLKIDDYSGKDMQILVDEKLSIMSSNFKTIDSKSLKILLEFGANPNITNADGEKVLCKAAKSGSYDIAELLIKYGADVNRCSKNFIPTPLSSAALALDPKIVELLLKCGAKTTNFKGLKFALEIVKTQHQNTREFTNKEFGSNSKISIGEIQHDKILKLINDVEHGIVKYTYEDCPAHNLDYMYNQEDPLVDLMNNLGDHSLNYNE